MPTWTIAPVARSRIAETVQFVDDARRALFPMLQDSPLPVDLAQFSDTYIDGPGSFLVAHVNNRLIAAIGYRPYDHRFTQLDYRAQVTVEVVRLYVAPAYRRQGLAGALFRALRVQAEGAGARCLYLHTHPFLPGAIRFWERQGFHIVDIETDPVWRTTHMEQRLEG